MFCGMPQAAPGQVLRGGGAWVVPEGVYSVSVVCVGSTLFRGATVLVRALNGQRVGQGGGDGGAPGNSGTSYLNGGGGAGGYTGNGGRGGGVSGSGSSWSGIPGSPGAGGGGGGGGGGAIVPNFHPEPPTEYLAGPGGGVGLRGLGANGTGGTAGAGTGGPGGPGSPGGTTYGGGPYGSQGAALSWSNDIPVVPGETLTVTGTVTRILWGGGRSFPSNAGDL